MELHNYSMKTTCFAVAAASLLLAFPLRAQQAAYSNGDFFLPATGTFFGNGSGLTNFNAANLTGTVPDARLSATVARLDGSGNATNALNIPGVPGITFGQWQFSTNANGLLISNTVSSGSAFVMSIGHQLTVDGNPVLTNGAVSGGLFALVTNNAVSLTNLNVWTTFTNAWTINTALPLGDAAGHGEYTVVSSTATLGFVGITGKTASESGWAQIDLRASGGDVTFTNPPGCHPSDNQLSRVCTNGNSMTIAVQVVGGGAWTNTFITQGGNQ